MPRRPRHRLALVALTTALLGACGGNGGDEVESGPDHPRASFQSRAAMACTEVLNDRPAVFATGTGEMLRVLAATVAGEPVDPDSVDVDAVRAAADEMARTADSLGDVDTDGASTTEGAAWEDVLAAVDERASALEGRAAALESADTDEISNAFEPISPPAIPDEALADLDFTPLGTTRDCASLLDGEGAAGDSFHAEAATACAEAVQAEAEGTVSEDRETMVELVLTFRTDGLGEVSEATQAAVDRLAAALRATADHLDDVAPDEDRAEDWATVVAAVDERAAIVERRAEALAGGSDADIRDAFAPDGGIAVDGVGEALERLGLAERECRLLTA